MVRRRRLGEKGSVEVSTSRSRSGASASCETSGGPEAQPGASCEEDVDSDGVPDAGIAYWVSWAEKLFWRLTFMLVASVGVHRAVHHFFCAGD